MDMIWVILMASLMVLVLEPLGTHLDELPEQNNVTLPDLYEVGIYFNARCIRCVGNLVETLLVV